MPVVVSPSVKLSMAFFDLHRLARFDDDILHLLMLARQTNSSWFLHHWLFHHVFFHLFHFFIQRSNDLMIF